MVDLYSSFNSVIALSSMSRGNRNSLTTAARIRETSVFSLGALFQAYLKVLEFCMNCWLYLARGMVIPDQVYNTHKDKWSKYLVMVSLIIIAMVCDLNGLSDFTLALSVRV